LSAECLKMIHIVLYDWTDNYSLGNIKTKIVDGAITPKRFALSQSSDLILAAALAYIPSMLQVDRGTISVPRTEPDFHTAVHEFVMLHWCTNDHFIGREEIERWLLPSFLT